MREQSIILKQLFHSIGLRNRIGPWFRNGIGFSYHLSKEVRITFAHLPAGYIACRLLFSNLEQRITSYWRYLFWGMFGAAAPDLDHIYLILFDFQQPDHHLYFTHYPLFWISLVLFSFAWLTGSKNNGQTPALAFLFSIEGAIHILLDTVPRNICLLAPFSYRRFSIEDLIHRHFPMLLQKYPCWELCIEALIIAWAACLLFNDRNAEKIKNRLKGMSH
jgi:hypothetical protein